MDAKAVPRWCDWSFFGQLSQDIGIHSAGLQPLAWVLAQNLELRPRLVWEAGLWLLSCCNNFVRSLPGVADEVGEADAAVSIAEEGEAGEIGDAVAERGDAGEVADGVLGKAVRPAANDGDGGCGEWAEDAVELVPGEVGDVVVGGINEPVGDGAAEKGAEEAASGGDAMGELLVDEGAGEERGL